MLTAPPPTRGILEEAGEAQHWRFVLKLTRLLEKALTVSGTWGRKESESRTCKNYDSRRISTENGCRAFSECGTAHGFAVLRGFTKTRRETWMRPWFREFLHTSLSIQNLNKLEPLRAGGCVDTLKEGVSCIWSHLLF